LNVLPEWLRVEKRHGDNRPLNEDRREFIDTNRDSLLQLINPDRGFVEHLFNSQHKDHIKCGVNTTDKVERLLDIVRRRSVADFNKLVNALHTGGQPYLAQMLEQGGGNIIKEILLVL